VKTLFRNIGLDFSQKIGYTLINWIIKGIILIALIYIINAHLTSGEGIHQLWLSFKTSLSTSNLYLLILAAILLPLNWYFESHKWITLTRSFEEQTHKKAISAILCGITLAIITPNRVGEYGGRILFLKPENKAKGLVANFVASISQNSINVSLGFIAAILFYDFIYSLNPWTKASLLFVWTLVTFLILLIYFNIDILRRVIRKFTRFTIAQKIYDNIIVVKSYSYNILFKVSGLSLLRFVIYLTQYILLLKFFGISASLWIMVFGVATIYFVQTGVPLPPLLGILARGEIAILVWSFFSDNELSILAATYSLWILNLVFPALIGLGLLLKTNLLKSFGYGNEGFGPN
jgi:hypothetical protein